jgi:hypothetical protein
MSADVCQCGAEVLDQKGLLMCGSCGKHCVFCACARPGDIAIPDTRQPVPEGLWLWGEGPPCP